MIQKFFEYCKCEIDYNQQRDYTEIKKLIKNEFNYDVDEKVLKEYELVLTDKQVNKDYQQGEMYITNSDFARMFMEQEINIQENNATVGNVSSMGAVVTAQPSSVPGQTIGIGNFSTPSAGDSYGSGGIVGSGDIGSNWATSISNNKTKRKKHKIKDIIKKYGKNIKNVAKYVDYKQGGTRNAIKTFSEYIKK